MAKNPIQPGAIAQGQGLPVREAGPPPVVTIDGPAGTGKSTLALRLAKHFSWRYIDSGAMYRALALCAAEQGHSWMDEEALAVLGGKLCVDFAMCHGHVVVRVGGRDVTQAIRSQAVGEGASRVATWPSVRARLVDKQRALGRDGGLVMDGRDIGTVVFPEAEVKFYLDATPEVRGQRRWLDLQARGEQVSYAAVLAAVRRRDHEDRTRAASPLVIPRDAYYIDTTNLSVDEVFKLMVDRIKFFGVSFRSPASRQGTRCPKST